MSIEIGKTYTQKELADVLGVKYETFRKKKASIMEQFGAAYEYEEKTIGRGTTYTVIRQIGEYEPPLIGKRKELVTAVLIKFVEDLVKKEELQTSANMGRIIFDETRPLELTQEVLALGLKQSTIVVYLRKIVKEMFGKAIHEGGTTGEVDEKVWCRLERDNVYIPVPQEHIDYFNASRRKIESEIDVEQDETFSEWTDGMITKKEAVEILGTRVFNSYAMARDAFMVKYGYWMIRVPRYKVYGYNCMEKWE